MAETVSMYNILLSPYLKQNKLIKHFLFFSKWRLYRRPGAPDPERAGEEARPGVSIIKPLVGTDTQLIGNIETFFKLDYPKVKVMQPRLSEIQSVKTSAGFLGQDHCSGDWCAAKLLVFYYL